MPEELTPRIKVQGDRITAGDLSMAVQEIAISGDLHNIPTYRIKALPAEVATDIIRPDNLLSVVDQWANLVNRIDTAASIAAEIRQESIDGVDTYDLKLEGLILKNVSPGYSVAGRVSHVDLTFAHPAAGADHAGYSIGLAAPRRPSTNSVKITSATNVLTAVIEAIREALAVVDEAAGTTDIEAFEAFRKFLSEEGNRALEVLTKNFTWGIKAGFPITTVKGEVPTTLAQYLPTLIAEEVVNANTTPLLALQTIMRSYALTYNYQPWSTGTLSIVAVNPWRDTTGVMRLQDGSSLSSSYISNPIIGMYNMTNIPVDSNSVTDSITGGVSTQNSRLVGGVTNIASSGYYGSVSASFVPHWVGLYVQRKAALIPFTPNSSINIQTLPTDATTEVAVQSNADFLEQTTLTNHYMTEDFTTKYQSAAMQYTGPALPEFLNNLSIGSTQYISRDGENLYKGYIDTMSLILNPQNKTANLNVSLTHTMAPTGIPAIGITSEHFSSGRTELLYNSNELKGA